MGDINADFNRNTKYLSRLVTYLDDININMSWDSLPIDYTHELKIIIRLIYALLISAPAMRTLRKR